MTTLPEAFAQRLSTDPDATYTVLITVNPDAADKANAALESISVKPVDGLQGIYKANLSGHELLKLQHDDTIQAIEPDDLEFHALS